MKKKKWIILVCTFMISSQIHALSLLATPLLIEYNNLNYPTNTLTGGTPDPSKVQVKKALNINTNYTLVNKSYSLQRTNNPVYLTTYENQQMTPQSMSHYKKMEHDARKSGITSHNLHLYSCLRNFEQQSKIFYAKVSQEGYNNAIKEVAFPGRSEHQSGYACDFWIDTTPYEDRTNDLSKNRIYQWLKANAYKYGFILRYPKNKILKTGYVFEYWHWRYVGVHSATEMKLKNIPTLEDYFEYKNWGITPPKSKEEINYGHGQNISPSFQNKEEINYGHGQHISPIFHNQH